MKRLLGTGDFDLNNRLYQAKQPDWTPAQILRLGKGVHPDGSRFICA